ncbi:hypothetical protein AB0M12_17560 [Nocardia vinacea]|uniref:hypothetical protein n=1 Tax=Nocardia vinacea TaxID=96468 RepID=UPI00342A4E83
MQIAPEQLAGATGLLGHDRLECRAHHARGTQAIIAAAEQIAHHDPATARDLIRTGRICRFAPTKHDVAGHPAGVAEAANSARPVDSTVPE